MAEKVRVGVIGAGRIAQRHFLAYSENAERATVVAIADPSEAAARASAEKWGVKETCADYRELLRRDDIEAVSICAPTALHPRIAIDAFAAGKHVLCEKPAGLDAAQFRAAMDAGRQSGKVFAMGFMERQMSNFAALREIVQSGRLGRPLLLRTSAFGSLLYKNPAFVDGALNGGPFIDMFCHNLDTWSCALGSRVVSVSASGYCMSEGAGEAARVRQPCLDTGDALLNFASGDVGVWTAGWSMIDVPQLNALKSSIQDSVIGPKGFILGGIRGKMRVVTSEGEQEYANDGFDIAHRKQISAFCAAIRDGAAPAASADDGLYTLRVSLAVLTAMKEKRTVQVDEI